MEKKIAKKYADLIVKANNSTGTKEALSLIKQATKLKTKILCVTHDISTITKIYDRVIMLKDGKIIADGDQNEVINSENLNKLYSIQVEVTNNNGIWNINRLSK